MALSKIDGEHFSAIAASFNPTLKRDWPEAYSRRINIQHRLVYEVFPAERIVRVLRMWTHYE